MEYFKQFKQTYMVNFWRPTPAVIALGVLAAYYFGITGTYWAVTGEFTRWGGHILQFFGVDISNWGYYKIMKMEGTSLTRVDGVMIIGMFAGCIAAAFWGNNVKLRMPASNIRIFQALMGGIIAGFGARLGMGCNLASLFTGIPQFSVHAWFFTLAMIIGVYLGTKVTMLPFFQSKIKLQKVSCSKELQKDENQIKSFFTIGSFVFISAFRDIFTTGRSELAVAIVLGMAVSTIGVFSYIMIGSPAKIMWAGPNAILGGLLFGFGIVLAGGCECGWMYRAVEGQVHFWIVGIGNVIGATFLAFTWDSFSLSMATSWPKINLLESFGSYGGLFMNYILLFLLFLLILKLEKNYRQKLKTKGN